MSMAVIRIVFKAVDISHSSKSNDLPKAAIIRKVEEAANLEIMYKGRYFRNSTERYNTAFSITLLNVL